MQQQHTCSMGGCLQGTTCRTVPGQQVMASLMGPLMGTGSTVCSEPADVWDRCL
jgi:hypothetical protein